MRKNDGWARRVGTPSLPESFRTIPVRKTGPFWRRFMGYIGPGYLVAVGYMDPGNWATSIAGGSSFGYQLLAVVLISNIMAILLQALCTRLGIGAERDLAQACHDSYSPASSFALWLLAEAAIVATDLAEVIGTAIALQLLFAIPLSIGVIITAADVFLILLLQNVGFRWIEAFIIALLLVIFACFGIQMVMAQPDMLGILAGFVPSAQIVTNPTMLFIALGILGATVMPHNLYLHSSIVQTRKIGPSKADKDEAIHFATLDSTIALMLALSINAAILILAAATFHKAGLTDIAEIQDAFKLLAPMLGAPIAATLFAVALLASGLNSTVTATLAGQIVMEGFLNIRLAPWLRRLITRTVAIIPAVIVTLWYGDSGTAKLLIASQVVLSLQLPFAIVPLVMFTADKSKMGAFTAPRWLTLSCAIIGAIIIVLNAKLLWDVFAGAVTPL